MKLYADTKRNAAQHTLTVGQTVLITNNAPHRNKYTPRWLPTPGQVTAVKGNSISINYKNKDIMRSSSQVKPYFANVNTPTTLKPITQSAADSFSSSSDSDSDTFVEPVGNSVANQDHDISSIENELDSDATVPYSDSEEIDVHSDADANNSVDDVVFNPLPQRET